MIKLKMDSEKTNILEDPAFVATQGGPTRPIHISTQKTWDEQTRQIEDDIRMFAAFEGRWQSIITNGRLTIPEQLRHIFADGGVVAPSQNKNLLLFGSKHWLRYSRVIAKDIGTDPVHNDIARLTFSNMHRFKISETGDIDIPADLLEYAAIDSEVAIIGVMYHAELHNKQLYLSGQTNNSYTHNGLAFFNRLRFNKRKHNN